MENIYSFKFNKWQHFFVSIAVYCYGPNFLKRNLSITFAISNVKFGNPSKNSFFFPYSLSIASVLAGFAILNRDFLKLKILTVVIKIYHCIIYLKYTVLYETWL